MTRRDFIFGGLSTVAVGENFAKPIRSALGARGVFARNPAQTLPYDAEVKYLESTGTQWIVTGITADQDILLECTGRWTDISTTVVRYAVNADNNGRISFGWLLNRTGTSFGLAAITNPPTVANADTEWHSVRICSTADSPYYEFDGEKSSLTPQSSVSLLGVIKLFGNGTGNAYVSISHVKISRPSTGQTLLDLIPVRFTNELGESEGAMYDKVSRRLFRNQGTGKFLFGADADMPYDYAVEYIETDGVASYIDTGVEFDADVRLLFNLAFVGEYDSAGTANNNIAFNFTSGFTSFRCINYYIAFTSFSFDTSGSVFYECEIQYFPGDKIAKVDGTTVGTSTSTIAPKMPSGTTFVIGALNKNGAISNVGHVKCAKFQIFDHDGNCKFNGTPVVANGVAGLYDSISGTVKFNAAASGTITAGPRV